LGRRQRVGDAVRVVVLVSGEALGHSALRRRDIPYIRFAGAGANPALRPARARWAAGARSRAAAWLPASASVPAAARITWRRRTPAPAGGRPAPAEPGRRPAA